MKGDYNPFFSFRMNINPVAAFASIENKALLFKNFDYLL